MATGMETLRQMGVYSHTPASNCDSNCQFWRSLGINPPSTIDSTACPPEISNYMQTCRTQSGCDADQARTYLTQYPQCYPGGLVCPQYLRDFLAECDGPQGCDPSLKQTYLTQYPQCNLPEPPAEQPNSMRIFSGVSDNCTRPTGPGIGANCCKSSPGTPLKNNRDILGSMAMQASFSVVKSGVGYGAQAASNYMFDFMFMEGGGTWMRDVAFDAYMNGAWDPANAFNLSVGAYGFTLSFGTAAGGGFVTGWVVSTFGAESIAAQGMGLLGAGGNLWTSGPLLGGDIFVSFNPYMLALSVSIQVVMDLYSCEPEEKMLATRRGGDLCEKTGEDCSAEIPIVKVCLQMTEHWCCWNSRLAKIITVEGGKQIGGGVRCNGFSTDELASIDFSKIDLSSFTKEILSSTLLPDGQYLSSTVQQGVNRGQDYSVAAKDQSMTPAAQQDPNMVEYVQGRVRMMSTR